MDQGRKDLTDPKVDAFYARQVEWAAPMLALRGLMLEAGLAEALKWGQPCYMWQGGNLSILGAFKTGLRLMFVKGVLLTQDEGRLLTAGENSRVARYLNFLSEAEIMAATPLIRRLLAEAKALEEAGAKVETRSDPEPDWPEELIAATEADPELDEAFRALTPGRRRYWLIHFAEAKQSATRTARISKARPAILAGRGMNER